MSRHSTAHYFLEGLVEKSRQHCIECQIHHTGAAMRLD
jgi:hypothetical protein